MYTLHTEHPNDFKVEKIKAEHFNRKDLRLTVDNPEDLVVCRKFMLSLFKRHHIDLEDIVTFWINADLKALTFPLPWRDIKPCIYNHMKREIKGVSSSYSSINSEGLLPILGDDQFPENAPAAISHEKGHMYDVDGKNI